MAFCLLHFRIGALMVLVKEWLFVCIYSKIRWFRVIYDWIQCESNLLKNYITDTTYIYYDDEPVRSLLKPLTSWIVVLHLCNTYDEHDEFQSLCVSSEEQNNNLSILISWTYFCKLIFSLSIIISLELVHRSIDVFVTFILAVASPLRG